MVLSTWSSLIAMFSTFMYTCLSLFSLVMLLYVGDMLATEVDDPDASQSGKFIKSFYSVSNTAIFACDLIAFMAMVIVSVLLQIGVKQERHRLIFLWICGSIFIVTMKLTGLIISYADSQQFHVVYILLIVIQVLLWYPIYVYYKQIRLQEAVHIENCIEQNNGAVYYIGRASNSVYGPTTTCLAGGHQL